jgi:hypothetical protein
MLNMPLFVYKFEINNHKMPLLWNEVLGVTSKFKCDVLSTRV